MRAWLLLVALAACSEHHDPAAIAIDSNDCVTCHQADYADTTNLDHTQFGWGSGCADCHVTTAWTPAQQDHVEALFPITVAPHDQDNAGAPMRCNECHNFALGPVPDGGANADCIACHKRADTDPLHATVPAYVWSGTVHNFCLTCHTTGQHL
jgi:hypothetical protein